MGWINIDKILRDFKSSPRIKNKLETQIIKSYFKGKEGVSGIFFKNGRLEIRIKSSALFQELFLNRENIKTEINSYLKKKVVKEIILKRG